MASYPSSILDYLNYEISTASNNYERKLIRLKWQKMVSEEITDRYNARRITNATRRTYRTIESANVIRYHPYWDRISPETLAAAEARLNQLFSFEKRRKKVD